MTRSHQPHYPALDGLRAIAIMLVIAFHANGVLTARLDDAVADAVYEITFWGWTGVDLFFVISGFLITSILLQMKDTHRGDLGEYLRRFWIRRCLRIFPPYYLALLFYFVVLPRLAPGASLVGDVHGAPAWPYLTYVSNFYFIQEPGAPLGFTWSLCVEEQFYILWPLVVWWTSRRGLAYLTAAILVLSPFVRGLLAWTGTPSEAVHMLTFARLDALAAGGVVALALLAGKAIDRIARYVAILAVLGVVATWLVAGGWHGHVPVAIAGLSFTTLLYAALLALAVTHSPRWLETPWLVSYGRYSYAIYLYHTVVLAFVATSLKGLQFGALATYVACVAIGVVTCFGVGWLSYNAFERWILGLKRYIPR